MSKIEIKNGNNVFNNDMYMIYKVFTVDGEKFFMSIPRDKDNLDICLDFKEEYYNALLKNELIEQIKKRCDELYRINPNAVYILPNVSTYDLGMALDSNDNHAYVYIFNRLQKFVSHAYHSLLSGDVKVNEVITIITETESDKKFMHWLDINSQGFFRELDINKAMDPNINDNDGGSNPVLSGGDTSELSSSMSKPKVKTLVPKTGKSGFSSFMFVLTMIALSVAIGLFMILMIYFKKMTV